MRKYLCSLSLVAVAFGASKMTPNEPIDHFCMPMFAQTGYKAWDLKGEKGVYLDEKNMIVQTMQLNVFNGKKGSEQELDIRSPNARILMQENKAIGAASPIEIRGKDYTLCGYNWEWDGAVKKVTVHERVNVVFNQGFGDVLHEND
ncbi:MAG: hypothetical protein A2Y14_04455 [Verrucomicrobia bacterium GWF2_51_19]|nr:MAG: hypothetical protein A2Y14_04455 [Verrucomicrobia bacterium GWF2_51_19]HCJ12499.1 hypothetical protein [Opitutae bacterium]